MNPSAPFILRPVATSLVMIAIMLIGIVGYHYLPLSALPEVDYPTIQVQTFLPGASPDVMTTSVTAPLERQLGEMPGLKQMTSASSAGSSVITLQFDLSLSLDIAEQEVQAAINASGSLLPQTLPAPPVYAKVNPADAPILTIAVTSNTMPLTQVEDLADTRIAQKISQLSGVGLVSINGGQRPAVRVQANLHALASYGLNLDDLRTTISNANSNAPKGSFDGKAQAYTINANDQLQSADDYKNIIVAYKNGAPVRSDRCGHHCPECGEREAVELDEHHARDPAQRATPTRRERHLRGGFHPRNLTANRGRTSRRRQSDGAYRPHQHDPRLGVRRRVRIDACRRLGGVGDLPVPAQHPGHLHPELVGTAVHRGHLRSDVCAGLLAQQPIVDGTDDLRRLRGR